MTLMMTKMMSGKNNNDGIGDFTSPLTHLFNKQIEFQKKIVDKESFPIDDVNWFKYHMLAIQEELGELLKSDKRWKTHRNYHYDPDNKKEEIADVFVSLINICLFSGVDALELERITLNKINENIRRKEENK